MPTVLIIIGIVLGYLAFIPLVSPAYRPVLRSIASDIAAFTLFYVAVHFIVKYW